MSSKSLIHTLAVSFLMWVTAVFLFNIHLTDMLGSPGVEKPAGTSSSPVPSQAQTTTVTNPNGDKVETFTMAGFTQTTITHPDGGQHITTRWPDGSGGEVIKDGQGIITHETETVIDPKDGSPTTHVRIETKPNPDGRVTTIRRPRHGPSEKIETTPNPDGSSTTIYTGRDGSITTKQTNRDGSSTETTVHPNGSTDIIEFDANGRIVSQRTQAAAARGDGKPEPDIPHSDTEFSIPVSFVMSSPPSAFPAKNSEIISTQRNDDGTMTYVMKYNGMEGQFVIIEYTGVDWNNLPTTYTEAVNRLNSGAANAGTPAMTVIDEIIQIHGIMHGIWDRNQASHDGVLGFPNSIKAIDYITDLVVRAQNLPDGDPRKAEWLNDAISSFQYEKDKNNLEGRIRQFSSSFSFSGPNGIELSLVRGGGGLGIHLQIVIPPASQPSVTPASDPKQTLATGASTPSSESDQGSGRALSSDPFLAISQMLVGDEAVKGVVGQYSFMDEPPALEEVLLGFAAGSAFAHFMGKRKKKTK